MAGCIPSVSYNMKADIYKPTISQDATGAVVKSWTLEKTIDCVARGVVRKGVGENSTAVEINNYLKILHSMVKVRASVIIPTDRRVVRVRNSSGVIFAENQDPSSDGGFQGSTIFEPRGSTPLLNFDGSVIEYETVLMRQEIQRIDI
jgi:hypothetical protein